MFSGVAILNPEVEEADAYTYYNIGFGGSSVDYSIGMADYLYSSGSSYYYRGTQSGIIAGGYYGSSTYYRYYRGWGPVSISDIDSRTFISSAAVYFRPSYISYSQTCYFYLLNFDPQSTINAQDTYNGITSSYYLGSTYVSSTSSTYGFTISSSALNYLKTRIASQDEYIYFGVRGSTYNGYIIFNSNSNSYLRIYGDREAPSTPSMYSIPDYTTTGHVPLDWGDSTDRPAAPNYGGVTYQVGVFSSSNLNDLIRSSSWLGSSRYNVYGLPDGQYYFRAKAKDAGGFESSWSGNYADTILDRTAPTRPQFYPIPEYTKGTAITLSWTESVDAGSGLERYAVTFDDNIDFSSSETFTFSPSTRWTEFTSFTSGQTIYFRMNSNDRAFISSGYSSVVRTTFDAEPPTIPVMMSEPPYTRGQSNNFSWHPSIDQGVGIQWYKIQVSTTENFQTGTIVYDRFVTDTFDDSYLTTIGTKITKKVIDIHLSGDDYHITLMIWDIMGQSGFRDLLKESYFYDANGAWQWWIPLERIPSVE